MSKQTWHDYLDRCLRVGIDDSIDSDIDVKYIPKIK